MCAVGGEKRAKSRKKKHTSRRRTATHNEPLPVPLSSTCPCSTAPRNIAPNNPGPHVLWPHLAVVTPLCVTHTYCSHTLPPQPSPWPRSSPHASTACAHHARDRAGRSHPFLTSRPPRGPMHGREDARVEEKTRVSQRIFMHATVTCCGGAPTAPQHPTGRMHPTARPA